MGMHVRLFLAANLVAAVTLLSLPTRAAARASPPAIAQSESAESISSAAHANETARDSGTAFVQEQERDRDTQKWLAIVQIILGIFTLAGLWFAKVSADAAKVSADVAKQALTGLERPFLFLEPLGGRVEPGDVHGTGDEERRFQLRANVRYAFRNYGRSPGIIDSISISPVLLQVAPGRNVPAAPVATEDHVQIDVNMIVPGPDLTQAFQRNEVIACTERQHTQAHNDIHFPLWLFGRVEYHAVFGAKYERFFCWQHDGRKEGWREAGGSAHNFDRPIVEAH